MEGIIPEGISDVESGYGTPNAVEDLLTWIDSDLKSSNLELIENLKRKTQINEELRRENENLKQKNEDVNKNLSLLKREYEKIEVDFSNLDLTHSPRPKWRAGIIHQPCILLNALSHHSPLAQLTLH